MKKIRIYSVSLQFFLILSVFGFAFFTACSKENLVDNSASTVGVRNTGDEPNNSISSTSGGAFGQQVVPPVSTAAKAMFSGTFEHATNTWKFDLEWSGFTGNTIALEVRGPADWGQNGGLIYSVALDGKTSGKITQTTTLTDTQEALLMDYKVYYVVTSSAYPSGEIRAQILPNAR
jgi:hypothetical protein